MAIELTNQEWEFLSNTLHGIQQNSLGLTAAPPQEMDLIDEIIMKFLFNEDLEPKEVSYLQTILQVQSEIWGRRSSTANEKLPVILNGFVPQQTLQLIKSITTKLGANLVIDTVTKSPQLSPRDEGSTWIMTDPTRKHFG